MLVKDIRESFKKETGLEVFLKDENKSQNKELYNSEYVKWLENRFADFLTQ